MTAVAGYTLLEISRRRLLLALVLIAIALVLLLGVAPFVIPGFDTGPRRAYFLLSQLSGVAGFFVLISGFAIGMTVIYHDLDSGAAVGILVKPVTRLDYALGKVLAAVGVLILIAAVLSVVTSLLLLANGGAGYDYGAVTTNFLVITANALVMVLLVMALTGVMNNIVAGIIGFVTYQVFGAVSFLHTLVVNNALTASPWKEIINVVYWLVPHQLVSGLPRALVKLQLTFSTFPTEGRGGRRFDPYAGVPYASGLGEVVFWAAYCVVIGALVYLAVRRRQV